MRGWTPFSRAEGPSILPLSGWSAWLVTLIAATMAFLGVLALAAGLAAERLGESWRGKLDGRATVAVTAPPAERATRIERALAVLRTAEGVASARPLSDAEHAELLAPWLGEDVTVAELPIPRLIAVTTTGAGPDAARLQERLDSAAPGAVWDDHGAWRAPLAAAAERLSLLAWTGVGLVLAAAAAAVALAARATLAAHAEIIRVVRLIGGEDRYIARAFVGRLALRGLAGGLVGAGLAALALETLPAGAPGTGTALALMPATPVWAGLAAGVALAIAAVAGLAAALAARITLRRTT